MSSNSTHLVQSKAPGLGPEKCEATPLPALLGPLFPCVSAECLFKSKNLALLYRMLAGVSVGPW